MRKISANLILPVSSAPLRNGIIIINPDGSIADVIDTAGSLHEEAGLEFYAGTIIPGLVLPWFRIDPLLSVFNSNQLNALSDTLAKIEADLTVNGIRGLGLVLADRLVSREVLEQLSKSHISFHPVIELCPGSNKDEFEVFNRGIELVSRAWNEFNLSCSLVACPHLDKNRDLPKYLREYNQSHQNIIPPEREDPQGKNPDSISSSPENPFRILQNALQASPEREFETLIKQITLDAAARIFEEDELGSIETGKTPGINLLTGYQSGNPAQASRLGLKVLI